MGPNILTPRDSRSFNAPLRKGTVGHHRIPTDELNVEEEVVDELAVTSPRNAMFLPLRLEELDAIKK